MTSDQAVFGALIFIALVVGANFVMYAVARGAARSDSTWWNALSSSLTKPSQKKDTELDELRRRVQELQEHQGDPRGDSKQS
jgi:hypothetical protein